MKLSEASLKNFFHIFYTLLPIVCRIWTLKFRIYFLQTHISSLTKQTQTKNSTAKGISRSPLFSARTVEDGHRTRQMND